MLKPGLQPQYPANYSDKVLQTKGAAGRVTDYQDFTYANILSFAGNNLDATILVTALLKNGDGKFWPQYGKSVYIPLRDIKASVDNAAAEAKAKADAEAKAKADAAAKAAADKIGRAHV